MHNCESFTIPLMTRTVASVFNIGDLAPHTKCGLNVNLDCDVEQKDTVGENNLYSVHTTVSCVNPSIRFHVAVVLETLVLGNGALEDVTQNIRVNLREEIFDKAENAIYRLTELNGCAMRIHLNKHVREQEQDCDN